MNNESNENYNAQDYNPNRPQNNSKANQQDTEKVVDTAAKGAAEYLAPGIGGQTYDTVKSTPVVGDYLNKKVNTVAERLDEIPGTKNIAQNLNESGLTDAANKGIDLFSSLNTPSKNNPNPNTNNVNPLNLPNSMKSNNHNKGKTNQVNSFSEDSSKNFHKNTNFNSIMHSSSEETISGEENNLTANEEVATSNSLAISEEKIATSTSNNEELISEPSDDTSETSQKTPQKNIIWEVLKKNPWLWGITAVFILFFLLLLFSVMQDMSDDNDGVDAYSEATCNINEISVALNNCYDTASNKEELARLSLEDYVLGATYAYTEGKTYSDETLKAMMIVLKTNALSYGGFNSGSKLINLKSCSINNNYCDLSSGCYTEEEGFYDGVITYKTASSTVSSSTDNASSINKTLTQASESYQNKLKEIYDAISSYLYISESYKSSLSALGTNNALTFNTSTMSSMESLASNGSTYEDILSTIYNIEGNEEPEQVVTDRETLFLGDSRMSFMVNYGVTNNSNTIYGGSCRYEWMVGTSKAEPSRSNYPDGGIKGINTLIKEGTSYNIVIWMGANDIGNYNKYFEKYKELATGEWANHELYVVSIGPVLDSRTLYLKNKDIVVFNENMSKLINESNINNLHYIDLNYTESDIKAYDSEGLHYVSAEDNTNIYNIIMKNIGEGMSSKKKIYNFKNYCNYSLSNSTCSTATVGANLSSFINGWEGTAGDTCTINGLPGRIATYYPSLDNTITVGPGITSMIIPSLSNYIAEHNYGGYFHNNNGTYTMRAGDCIPDKVTQELKEYALEHPFGAYVDNAAAKVGLNLTEYQRDALTSFCYNTGCSGGTYAERALTAYKNNGLEGLWNYIKSFNTSPKGVLLGLKRRRKSELYLFATGDYTHFTSASDARNNYDNYDSEGIVALERKCSSGDGKGLEIGSEGYMKRTTRPLRDNAFYYVQDATNYGIGTNEGECAWYATHRAQEILATAGSSKTWNSSANGNGYCYTSEVTSGQFKTSTNVNAPKVGSLISWGGGSGHNYGHVAVVEEVNSDGSIYVSEAGVSFGSIGRAVWNSGGNKLLIRKNNCEGNGSGCFHYRKIEASRIRDAAYGSSYHFICYVYLLD